MDDYDSVIAILEKERNQLRNEGYGIPADALDEFIERAPRAAVLRLRDAIVGATS